ncbi:MAG: hypothetical protein EXR58_05075 [Chloroflexi bacterium]|nr:hypothetical protein [Chloroflexota bacterium]
MISLSTMRPASLLTSLAWRNPPRVTPRTAVLGAAVLAGIILLTAGLAVIAGPFGASRGESGVATVTNDGPTLKYGFTAEELTALAPAPAVLDRHKRDLLKMEGVNGVSVGRDSNGAPAIIVFHENYATEFPASLEGVPVVLQPCDGAVDL